MTQTDTTNIRIVLVDDHALFRESVARLLQAEAGFEVIANCASVSECLQILNSREVDILLLDLDLGPERGIDLLENLGRHKFKGKVLLVTAGVNESDIVGLIQKGIAGVFLKHGSPASLVQGIRDAMEGKALFGQDLLRKALESTGQLSSPAARAWLSEREKRMLSLIFEGLANKQIADRMSISESAVKSCLQQLFSKTGVRTRSQLVRIVLEQYRDQI